MQKVQIDLEENDATLQNEFSKSFRYYRRAAITEDLMRNWVEP